MASRAGMKSSPLPGSRIEGEDVERIDSADSMSGPITHRGEKSHGLEELQKDQPAENPREPGCTKRQFSALLCGFLDRLPRAFDVLARPMEGGASVQENRKPQNTSH